ncbi:MAG: TIR domain-containing protein [Candidatus Thorarchaeota archaeon]
MLSLVGWINGISVTFKVFFDFIVAIIFFYKYRKENVKILLYFAIAYLCGAIVFFTYFFDFMVILSTGTNTESSIFYNLAIVSYLIVGPFFLMLMFSGIDLLLKERRWYIMPFYLILMSIYEFFFIFINYSNALHLKSPTSTGENLIFIQISINTPQFIIMLIFFISILVFNCFGFLLRSRKSEGIIKKKFQLLSIAFFLFFLAGIFEGLIEPGIYSLFTRIIFESTAFLVYYALMPKKVKKHREKPYKREKELIAFMEGKSINNLSVPNVSSIREKDRNNIIIFISYATKDTEVFNIQKIAKSLTKYKEIENVLYWQEHLEDNIFKYMNDNLGTCDLMILFCSENALNSIPVEKEWTAADALNKPIIPVFTEPKYIPPLLSSRLGLQYDFNDMERNVIELRNLILKKVGGLVE